MPPTDHFFVAFDKTPIHYIRSKPEGTARANMLIVHGAGEHAARYNAFAAYLAENGVDVHAIDLRGYGKSGGTAAFVTSFEDYAKDFRALIGKIRKESAAPFFLFGHSMGGLVAAWAAPRLAGEIDGLILSSPCFAFAFQVPEWLSRVAKVLSVLAPAYCHPTYVVPQNLTHDPDMIREYQADKLICYRISSRLYAEMTSQMARYLEIARDIPCPLIVLQAGDDRVVDSATNKTFFDAVSQKDKEFRLFSGLYHEVLNETNRQVIYRDLLTWITSHCK